MYWIFPNRAPCPLLIRTSSQENCKWNKKFQDNPEHLKRRSSSAMVTSEKCFGDWLWIPVSPLSSGYTFSRKNVFLFMFRWELWGEKTSLNIYKVWKQLGKGFSRFLDILKIITKHPGERRVGGHWKWREMWKCADFWWPVSNSPTPLPCILDDTGFGAVDKGN